MILLSLFDSDVSLVTKRAMVKASEDIEGEEEPSPRARVDMTNIKDKTLVDFVTKNSRRLFEILDMPDKFLEMDPETWNNSEDFETAQKVVYSLATTNDHAERGVSLIQQMTQSGRFRNEDQLQYALQIVEQSQTNIPDMNKTTLMQQ